MRAWLSRVSSDRLEPVFPLFLGAHGLLTGFVLSLPTTVLLLFGGVAALGVAGLAGWRGRGAALSRGLTVLSIGLVVQLLEPDTVSSMLQWYYCVAAVYSLLLAGRISALMGPAAAACYLVQVSLGVGPVSAGVALLRAAVLIALGLTMYVAGRSYRSERDRAESRRVASELTGRELEHASTHDGLTGLPNRILFLREVSAQVVAHPPDGLAVIVLNVDRFTAVNDTFGHDVADKLLIDMAARLSLVAEDRVIARLGGDEFAVLHDSTAGTVGSGAVGVEAAAAHIRGTLEAPFVVHGHEHRLTLSIGIARHTTEGSGPDLMRAASLALHDAKSAGHGRVAVYEPAMAERAVQRSTLEQQLRGAVRDDRIDLAYQPIIDLATGRLRGVEALARWTPDGRGPIAPDVFIRLAEDIGLIGDLGRQVLARALGALATWQRDGVEVGSIAVNASPLQIHDPQFADTVRELLLTHRLDPSCLTLEITEGAVIQAGPVVVSTLERLRAIGVGISMDDFGTGYSSLARLRHLPVTELKIDRSFVAELDQDATLTRLVLSLANSLSLHTVAEGVETAEQLGTLRSMGAEAAQGYHIAGPMPEAELAAWPHAAMRPALA